MFATGLENQEIDMYIGLRGITDLGAIIKWEIDTDERDWGVKELSADIKSVFVHGIVEGENGDEEFEIELDSVDSIGTEKTIDGPASYFPVKLTINTAKGGGTKINILGKEYWVNVEVIFQV